MRPGSNPLDPADSMLLAEALDVLSGQPGGRELDSIIEELTCPRCPTWLRPKSKALGFPAWFATLLSWSFWRTRRKDARRLRRVVDVGTARGFLEARPLRRGLTLFATEDGLAWSAEVYAAAGRQAIQREGDEMFHAVAACRVLDTAGRPMRSEELGEVVFPFAPVPGSRDMEAMRSAHLEARPAALARALDCAQRKGWIAPEGEAWILTEEGRNAGVTYFDRMR